MKRFVFLRVAAFIILMLTIPAASGQETSSRIFDQTLEEKTVSFESLNPYTNIPGTVTLKISGLFHVKRILSGRKAGWSVVTGEQKGSFTFVPYDSSQPTLAGNFQFGLAGNIAVDRHNDTVPFDFIIRSTGSDGSEVVFKQREVISVNEYGADVWFGELKQLQSSEAEIR